MWKKYGCWIYQWTKSVIHTQDIWLQSNWIIPLILIPVVVTTNYQTIYNNIWCVLEKIKFIFILQ